MAKTKRHERDDETSSNARADAPTAATWIHVSELRPNPKNPRLHGQEVLLLARTIVRTTWGAPILVQARTMRIIGGHGRLEAAKEILAGIEVDGFLRGGAGYQFRRDAPPECLPVCVLDVSDAEADAMTLADNAKRLQGKDDPSALVAMATATFERNAPTMVDMGLGADDLDALIRQAGDAVLAGAPTGDGDTERSDVIGDDARERIEVEEDEAPVDRAEELRAKWGTAAGQLWEIPSATVAGGVHRILCGDCRKPADVARLLIDRKVNVAFTSPPYAAQREYDAASGFTPIPADEYVAWFEPVQANVRAHLAPDGSWFVNIKEHCEDGQRVLYVKDLTLAHVRRWGWRFVDELCWTHRGLPGSWPNRFKNAWEPVFHFCAQASIKFHPRSVGKQSDQCFHEGGRVSDTNATGNVGWNGGDVQRVTDIALPSNVVDVPNNPANHGGASHSAAYPVGLPAFFVQAYSDPGGLIFDPFLGSATTIVAAEKTGRVGCGTELSPKYVAVCLERLAALGLTPRLVS